MLRVPELPHSIVRDSCERAATRRPPICCEDRLPHDQHSQLSVAVSRQQLLSCGGPPQTSRSSWRKKQDEARNVSLGIEPILELPEISFRECDNRLLAAWRRARTPQVYGGQQYKNCRHPDTD